MERVASRLCEWLERHNRSRDSHPVRRRMSGRDGFRIALALQFCAELFPRQRLAVAQ